MENLIWKVYNYSEHKSSDKPNSISATGLLGPLYKGSLILADTSRDPSLVNNIYKRSSTLGSAFHAWAEKALSDTEDIHQEIYSERQIDIDGVTYTISGTCDLLVANSDGTWNLGDWKTGYGKERTVDQLEKDALQMSIYRWLNQDNYEIEDEAYSLFISQSNNAQKSYKIILKSIDYVDSMIRNKIQAMVDNPLVDCNDGVKYNSCNYCDLKCKERK